MTSSSSLRRRLATAIGIAGVVTLVTTPLFASAASAHPLGNFTINTSAVVIVGQDEVIVDYALDMAEIPTLQSGADADGDGSFENDELSSFATARCDSVADALMISVNGLATALSRRASTAATVTGSADLTTLRIDCRLSSDARPNGETGLVQLDVDDRYASEHLGWHEVVIAGDEMTVAVGDVLTSSPSEHLSNYPTLDAPLDITTAAADLRAGGANYVRPSAGPGVHSFIPGIDSMANRLIGDSTSPLTGWSAMILLGTAALLGALHAFAPGHGKTVMAAYLLGEQGGSVRQAFILGATVTATHTVGVLALGAMISLTTLSSPDSLYPWLGIASGLLVAGIGANLLHLAFRNRHDGGLIHLGHVHGPGGHTHADHDEGDHQAHGHANSTLDHEATGFLDLANHGAVAAVGDMGVGTLALARRDNAVITIDETAHPEVTLIHPVRHVNDDHGHDDHSHDNHSQDGHSHGPTNNQSGDPGRSHPHPHDHHVHDHDSAPGHHGDGRMKLGSVVAMGFAGGMVPSPSALIVLLGAVALGRTVFGIGLVAAYGLGMAATLVGVGLAFVVLRDRSARLLTSDPGSRVRSALRYGPLVTAVAVVGGGILIAARAATQL